MQADIRDSQNAGSLQNTRLMVHKGGVTSIPEGEEMAGSSTNATPSGKLSAV